MSASRIARAPRQAAILATIVGLHAGAVMLVMAGLHPRLDWLKPVPQTYIYPAADTAEAATGGAPPARAGRLRPAARARADGADPAFRRGSPGAGRRPHRWRFASRLRAWRTYAGTSGTDAAHEGQPAGRAHRRLLSVGIPPAGRGRACRRRRPHRRHRSCRRLEHRGTFGFLPARCGRELRGPPAGIRAGSA